MYLEFMKTFFSPIRANWWVLESFRPAEHKNVYSHFVDMMYVDLMKNFFSNIRAKWWVLEPFRTPEPKNVNSHSLDTMYVGLIKIFFLVDSGKLICVRVISASWAKKRLFPLSRHDVCRVFK